MQQTENLEEKAIADNSPYSPAPKEQAQIVEAYTEEIRKLWDYREEIVILSRELFNLEEEFFNLEFQLSEEGERCLNFALSGETGTFFISGNTNQKPGSFALAVSQAREKGDLERFGDWLKPLASAIDSFSRFVASRYSSFVLSSNITKSYPSVEIAFTVLAEIKSFKENNAE